MPPGKLRACLYLAEFDVPELQETRRLGASIASRHRIRQRTQELLRTALRDVGNYGLVAIAFEH